MGSQIPHRSTPRFKLRCSLRVPAHPAAIVVPPEVPIARPLMCGAPGEVPQEIKETAETIAPGQIVTETATPGPRPGNPEAAEAAGRAVAMIAGTRTPGAAAAGTRSADAPADNGSYLLLLDFVGETCMEAGMPCVDPSAVLHRSWCCTCLSPDAPLARSGACLARVSDCTACIALGLPTIFEICMENLLD